MPIHNKLVRDKIPEIIEKTGKVCHIHTLTSDEYLAELDRKLNEECAECERRLPYRQNEHNCTERKDENGVRINGVVRQSSGVFVRACNEKGLRKVGNNQSSVSGTLRGL